MTFDELKSNVAMSLSIVAIAMLTYVSCKQSFIIRDQARLIYGQGLESYNYSKSTNFKVPHRVIEKRNQGTTISYVPPEGSVKISPRDETKKLDDLIKIERKTWGFTRELGLQSGLFTEPNVGLDCKLFYIGRFGFNIGILGGKYFPFAISPTASVSYRLDRISWIHNTEVWAGVVPLSQYTYQLGLRINI